MNHEFFLFKANKVSKHGNTSSFTGLEDEDIIRKCSTRSPQEENFQDKDYRQGHSEEQGGLSHKSAKKSSNRSKEPCKLNIDSIIEEENRERALIGGSTIIPKIQMIEIPSKNKVSENYSYNKASERPNIQTSVDKWGFVINSKALHPDRYEIKGKAEEFKSRQR